MKKRVSVLEFACVILIAAVLGALAVVNAGCGMVAGIGRDVTAMAEGGATKAADDAAKINGKGQQ